MPEVWKMLRHQIFKSIIESELSESELSEFIKTRTLPERMKKQIFDQDYVKRHQDVMTKRRARDATKPIRKMERTKAKIRRAGFPDTRAMFAREDIQSMFDEMCGADHGNPKKKKVKEQMDPNQAMMPRMIPGSPAERMAKKRMQAMRTARPVSREQDQYNDIVDFIATDLLEFIKTSKPGDRLVAHGMHKLAKKLGPKVLDAGKSGKKGERDAAGYFKKYHHVMARREVPLHVRQSLLQRGIRRATEMKEQMVAQRGSTFDKIAARSPGASGGGPTNISGGPADVAARKAAFEKQRASWNAPKQVQRQRTPIPTGAAVSPPVAIKPVAPPAVRPVNTSDRMKAAPMRRPITGYGAPRPAMRGGRPI